MSATRSSTVERYLETIYYIAAEGEVVRPGRLSSWLEVSPPTVSEALRRLERDGWITLRDDRSVVLTEQGEAAAAAVVRRHRILERWLTDVLGFDWASADVEAERIASTISDDVIDRIDASMGCPTTCPHGNVIPGRIATYGALGTLSELPVGDRAQVRRISEVSEHESQVLLRALSAHGVVEGGTLRIISRDSEGAVTLESGDDHFTIGAEAARSIWVDSPS